MKGKVQRAVETPHLIYPYVRNRCRAIATMARQDNFGEIVGYITEEAVGEDIYFEQLGERAPDGIVSRSLPWGEMYLDLTDPGLSRRLLRYGVHEKTSSRIYRRELRRLAEDVGHEITVFELGANIGYFLLIASEILGDRARFYAIEPHPRNLALLEKNVDRNGLSERTEIIEGAIGAKPGSGVLNVMLESNWHAVASDGGVRAGAIETLDIDIQSVETLLSDRDLEPEEVNVVRFDVEGYEDKILAGMQSVLDADSPLLCYIELHPVLLDDDTLDWVIETIEESGLSAVSAVDYEPIDWDGKPVPFSEFSDIWNYRETGSLEIIARR